MKHTTHKTHTHTHTHTYIQTDRQGHTIAMAPEESIHLILIKREAVLSGRELELLQVGLPSPWDLVGEDGREGRRGEGGGFS